MLVRSEPSNATVYVDGQAAPTATPTVIEKLECGVRRVKITLPHHEDVDREVTVGDAKTAQLAIAFRRRLALLQIAAIPSEADVIVNGKPAGVTPVTLQDLPWGDYAVRVEKPGYLPEEHIVTVDGPGPHARTFSLRVRAPERVPARISTFGYEGVGGLQAVLSLGILGSQYAVELDGTLILDWRIRSIDHDLALEPGPHRLRVLIRNLIARQSIVVYEGTVAFTPGSPNQVNINFLLSNVTANGVTEDFQFKQK